MLIPLLSLLVGMAIFSVSSLVYAGVPIIKSVPWIFKLKNHHEILLGLALISMALMLGIVGYFGYIDGSLLRMIRVFLGIGGLLVMSFPVLHKYRKTHNFIARIYSLLTLKTGLTIASLILLFSIFLISFFDGNYGGDAYMYHLPFAARIWGITSPEQY
ncbi:MAG: hypothetical protein WBM62_22070, partial [Crocosphaera sp.]